MKILITGDRGFVGTATRKALEERGHTVIGFDIMDGKDIRRWGDVYEALHNAKPDRVLHLAAIARFNEAEADPVRAFDTNYLGTKNVVGACDAFNVPLVHASTGSCYMPIKCDPPITEDYPIMGNSVYGCTKAAAEKVVQGAKVPWIALRYAHLYGAEKRFHGLIGGFLARIEHDMEPVLYGGKQSNDFCYIKDIADANVLALEASFDKYNQAYNIGTGEELTAEEAGRVLCDVIGYAGDIVKKEQREVDPQRFVYDMTKAETMLGFKARYSFHEGLMDMAREGAFEVKK